MGQTARKSPVGAPEWAVFGLEDAAAHSFRQAARERAPGLAAAYVRVWRRVSGRVGRAPWPAPWPGAFGATISWRRAGGLALAGLHRLDGALARRAGSAWLRGRARPLATLAPGQWNFQCRARGVSARIGFDGSLTSAAALAHAMWLIGHGTKGWLGPSAPPPVRAATEVGGAMARLAFADVLGETSTQNAQYLRAEMDLTYLVRMPALDVAQDLVDAGRDPLSAWKEAAGLFAPALAWAEANSLLEGAGVDAPLVQAIGHASALYALNGTASPAAARGLFTAWGALGSGISLPHFSGLCGLALDSVASWRGVYDVAEEGFARMERAR